MRFAIIASFVGLVALAAPAAAHHDYGIPQVDEVLAAAGTCTTSTGIHEGLSNYCDTNAVGRCYGEIRTDACAVLRSCVVPTLSCPQAVHHCAKVYPSCAFSRSW